MEADRNLTVEGGVRWVLLAAVVLDDQQHRQLRSAVLRSGQRGGRSTRRLAGCVGGRPLQRHRAAGRRIRGRRQRPVVAQDPAVLALFRGEPRGFSETHDNVFEPRLGVAYSAQRQDDGPRQRRRLPQPRHAERLDAARRQPAVPAAGHRVATAASTTRAAAAAAPRDLPFGITAQDLGVQASDGLHVVGRRAARGAVRLHRRRDLRRPPRPVPAARAQHQPAAAGHDPGQPGRQHRGAAALQGLRRDPPVGERRPLDVQQPADQRRPPLQQRPEGRRRLHAGQVRGQRQRQAQRPVEHLRRHELLGPVELRPPAHVSTSTTSTTCRSGATRTR